MWYYLQECIDGSCVYLEKTCPFNCSSNGYCNKAYISTALPIEICRLNQYDCSATCVCNANYTGSGCQTELAKLTQNRIIRSVLVETLSNLTKDDDVTNENVISWSTYLDAVSDNPYELYTSDTSSIEAVATTTITAGLSLNLDYTLLTGVLQAIDTVSILTNINALLSSNGSTTEDDYTIASEGSSNATASNTATIILNAVSTFTEVIGSTKVYGEPNTEYIYTNFRLFEF